MMWFDLFCTMQIESLLVFKISVLNKCKSFQITLFGLLFVLDRFLAQDVLQKMILQSHKPIRICLVQIMIINLETNKEEHIFMLVRLLYPVRVNSTEDIY